jgi:hypothetical protein
MVSGGIVSSNVGIVVPGIAVDKPPDMFSILFLDIRHCSHERFVRGCRWLNVWQID